MAIMLYFVFFIAPPCAAEIVAPGMWAGQATLAKKIANEPMVMSDMEGGASAQSYQHGWPANEIVVSKGAKVSGHQ